MSNDGERASRVPNLLDKISFATVLAATFAAGGAWVKLAEVQKTLDAVVTETKAVRTADMENLNQRFLRLEQALSAEHDWHIAHEARSEPVMQEFMQTILKRSKIKKGVEP